MAAEFGVRTLQALGLPHVDVTPAAFMPWTPETVAQFKTNYLGLVRQPQVRKLFYSHEDMEYIKPGHMDLSLHPPGYLLGGDPFLCMPEEKRIEFNLWDDSGSFKPGVLSFYRQAYDRMHRQPRRVPYREHVCNSFELMNTMMGYAYMNTWAINDIMRFLTRTHMALGPMTYSR